MNNDTKDLIYFYQIAIFNELFFLYLILFYFFNSPFLILLYVVEQDSIMRETTNINKHKKMADKQEVVF